MSPMAHVRVLDGLLAGSDGALDDVAHQLLQLGAAQLDDQVLGAGGVGGDERQVDLGLLGRRKLDLGLLGRFLQALQGHAVLGQVDALVLLELLGDPVDQPLVDVVAAQVGVAVGRLHLDDVFADLQDRDVEGAAAEVIDGDQLVLLLVHAVGQGRGRRLVDDALDVEAGDLAGVLGGLALGVVEVGRDGDDRLGHFFAQVILGRLLQLLQDQRRDLGRRILLAHDAHPGVVVGPADHLEGDHLDLVADFGYPAPHEALDGIDGVFRIGDRLALGHLADQPAAVLGEADHRRRGAPPFRVGDDLDVAFLHYRYSGIGCSQVNADYFSHVSLLSF